MFSPMSAINPEKVGHKKNQTLKLVNESFLVVLS